MGQKNNGTILAHYEPDQTADGEPFSMAGFSEDLQRTGNPSDARESTGINEPVGSISYKFTHRQDDRGNAFTALNTFNSSAGSILYKNRIRWQFHQRPDRQPGYGVPHQRVRSFWVVDQDGGAYCANNSDRARLLGSYGDGLLLGDGKSIEMIGNQGSPEWRYELREDVHIDFIRANDTVILMTNDTITAIYKPHISSTMMELIELVGGDLLIVLLGSAWLLDPRLHGDRKRL